MQQKLSLNLSQKLTMTAKLQQSIQILQLSAQELRAVIETEYLENPTLEMDESPESEEQTGKMVNRYSFEDIRALAEYLGDGGRERLTRADREQGFEAVACVRATLEDVLVEQVNLNFTDKVEHQIARYIVGSIDSRGYLTSSVEEIASTMAVDEACVRKVLSVVQTFEPDGVGARSLRECLMLQAKRQGLCAGLVAILLEHYLDEIAKAHFKTIAEKEGCAISDVQAAVDIIRCLNPKPGAVYGGADTAYIVPDVVVREINGEYVVLVNDYGIPRLNISAVYKNGAAFDRETRKYIETRVSSAIWLIKSIEQRRNTLFNVVTEIIKQQRPFLDQGPDALRPMRMKSVAENINVHESTVSRAVANKYVETPHGVMSLKSFFAVNLNPNGEELIAGQVKAMIKKMIEMEEPRKPWSDQQLSEMLAEQKMKISRRTVMKYREQMGYSSSTKRKRY